MISTNSISLCVSCFGFVLFLLAVRLERESDRSEIIFGFTGIGLFFVGIGIFIGGLLT